MRPTTVTLAKAPAALRPPPAFQLPYAPPAHLVVSAQKDDDYLHKVTDQIIELATRWFGVRRVNQWDHEIRIVLARLLYAVPSAVLGRQSLGEEHVEILPLPFSRLRIALCVLYDILVPYFLAKLPQAKEKHRLLLRCHLALFYFSGAFYEISKRLAKVRFVCLSPTNSQDATPFTLLGVLLAAELMTRAFRHGLGTDHKLSRAPQSGSVTMPHSPTRGEAEDDSTGQCTLCLGPRRCPTATMCGHIYCWECITSYMASQPGMPQCPLCRQHVTLQQLAPIARYRV